MGILPDYSRCATIAGEVAKQRVEISGLREEQEERRRKSTEPLLTELNENMDSFPGLHGKRAEMNLYLVGRDVERISENRIQVTEVRVQRTIKRDAE